MASCALPSQRNTAFRLKGCGVVSPAFHQRIRRPATCSFRGKRGHGCSTPAGLAPVPCSVPQFAPFVPAATTGVSTGRAASVASSSGARRVSRLPVRPVRLDPSRFFDLHWMAPPTPGPARRCGFVSGGFYRESIDQNSSSIRHYASQDDVGRRRI